MNDTDFFQKALGLAEPWRVISVQLDLAARRVVVGVAYGGSGCYDSAGQRLPIHGYEDRQWRHLDTMQFETLIQARVPRVRHPDGTTAMVVVPWAEPHSRLTQLFEAFAIQVLLASRSKTQGAALLRLDWQSAARIMQRAVSRGMQRRQAEPLRYVGLDEKSFRRGQDYISVLCDIEGSRVLEVAAGNDATSAASLLNSLPESQREQLQAVVIDMNAGYEAGLQQTVPQAAVVYDRFHVAQMLGQAVDRVRRQECRQLVAQGDKRLIGTKHLWLFDPAKLDPQRWASFQALLRQSWRTARAYFYRILFLDFWTRPSAGAGARFFQRWYARAIRSRLTPVKKVARTLKARLFGLLNYFRYPITNALNENTNGAIQAIKANARGFRSFENYRVSILFHLGKLELAPR